MTSRSAELPNAFAAFMIAALPAPAERMGGHVAYAKS
jgi:hypothetical protein